MNRSPQKPNWRPLPDPVTEKEIKLELNWIANARTTRAIKRQARLMGFKTPTAYLLQALAATTAGNEEFTFVASDGCLIAGEHLPTGRA